MTAIIFCKPLETCLHNTCLHNQGPISSSSKLKATAKIVPVAEPLVRDQHKGKAPMDPTTQTNTPSVPKLMADSFAASQRQAQRGTTTRTPAETEVTAKKRKVPSTAPALNTDLSDWDIPRSQMRKRRRLLLTVTDDEDPSTSPQHIHPIPSPISNVPREPTVQPTPPPPEASQQASLQPVSQSLPQQSTQSAAQHPSTSPQHIDPIPSPITITNVPREPTVEPTPPPPEASQQTSLQPPSQSSPQQPTQSTSHNPSQLEPPPIALRDVTVGAVSMEVDYPGGTEPVIVPSVFSPQPSPSNPSNSQTSNKESED
ncbi:extensin-like [Camellia sinensis]|uniref:extensin-like n=1 Tax=Camellia sinensis TaxID=4442 RepID=UPI001035CC5B|nr:extensin-like [Camellia sinensis]